MKTGISLFEFIALAPGAFQFWYPAESILNLSPTLLISPTLCVCGDYSLWTHRTNVLSILITIVVCESYYLHSLSQLGSKPVFTSLSRLGLESVTTDSHTLS